MQVQSQIVTGIKVNQNMVISSMGPVNRTGELLTDPTVIDGSAVTFTIVRLQYSRKNTSDIKVNDYINVIIHNPNYMKISRDFKEGDTVSIDGILDRAVHRHVTSGNVLTSLHIVGYSCELIRDKKETELTYNDAIPDIIN